MVLFFPEADAMSTAPRRLGMASNVHMFIEKDLLEETLASPNSRAFLYCNVSQT
jgi:hypothetical protein